MNRDELLQKLSQDLTDQGKLIEAGWISLQLAAISADAPATQLEECRMSFFAGASHLFKSIMTMLDPGDEPTEADLKRLSLINAELDAFLINFKRKHGIKDESPHH